MERNLFLDQDDNVGENVCHNDIVALVSSCVLGCLVVDDVSLDHAELLLRDLVRSQVFMDSRDRILIKISSEYIISAQF